VPRLPRRTLREDESFVCFILRLRPKNRRRPDHTTDVILSAAADDDDDEIVSRRRRRRRRRRRLRCMRACLMRVKRQSISLLGTRQVIGCERSPGSYLFRVASGTLNLFYSINQSISPQQWRSQLTIHQSADGTVPFRRASIAALFLSFCPSVHRTPADPRSPLPPSSPAAHNFVSWRTSLVRRNAVSCRSLSAAPVNALRPPTTSSRRTYSNRRQLSPPRARVSCE